MTKEIWKAGSRASNLAWTQSSQIVDLLRKKNPGLKFELEEIRTQGDKDRSTPLTSFGGEGIFVKELEKALLDHQIDFAIHSLKDVPHQLPKGLMLSCFPIRENPCDVLVTRSGGLNSLKQGAKVGTGSPRRILQLKAIRPDLNYEDLRGNVESRLAKVKDKSFDAIVLAQAGLNRLQITDLVGERLDPNQFLPAIGQGILALEVREDDIEMQKVLSSISNEEARLAAVTEREFMRATGGGCKLPMAAWARIHGDKFLFSALLGDHRKGEFIRSDQVGDLAEVDQVLARTIEEIEVKSKEANIPMPRDLPDHFLLQ